MRSIKTYSLEGEGKLDQYKVGYENENKNVYSNEAGMPCSCIMRPSKGKSN
jgi:hypothetical protein